MKRSVAIAALVLALAGAEWILRSVLAPAAASADLWRSEGALQVLQEDSRARVGGAAWSTDAAGHRRDLLARKEEQSSLRVLVLGGAFTAGAGLADEELYADRLQRHLREYTAHADAVVLQAVARGPVPDRVRWYARLVRDLAPDRVLIQVEPEDRAEVAPFAFVEGIPPEVTAPDEPWLGLARAWTRWRAGAARAAAEAAVADRVDRMGYSAEVIQRTRERAIRIQQALREDRPLTEADHEYLRTLLRVDAAQDRDQREAEARQAWTTLLDQVLSQGARVAVLYVGPGYLVRPERAAFQDLAVPEVFAPPLVRQEQLWVDGRPAALVHEQVARSLMVRLSEAGQLGADAQVPEAWSAQDRLLQGLFDRTLGQDDETARQARENLLPRQEFGGERVPYAVFQGLRPGGLVQPGAVVELLCFPGYRSESLEVEAELTGDGPAPWLTVSFARLAEHAQVEPEETPVEAGRRRVLWRMPDPGVVYRRLRLPLQLTFGPLPERADLRLRRLEWIQSH